MRASVIISDLTQMKGDRVCIAGYLNEEICVRPIFKNGGLIKDWLFKDDKVVISPFHKVEFDFDPDNKKPLGRPHTEDWHLRSKYCEYKGRLSIDEQRSFLERIDDKYVNNIFKAEILHGPGTYIRNGEGERSLGTISNPLNVETLYDLSNNKFNYRFSFADQSGNRYNLPITDFSFRYFLDYLSFRMNINYKDAAQLVTGKLRNADVVFVRIGLTRGTWHVHPGKCFLQVNGIYSFPDYLDGGSFRDYELNHGELMKKRQIFNLRDDSDDRKLNQIRSNETPIKSDTLRSFNKIKVKYPRAYKYWSDDEDNKLIQLIRSGKTILEMAETLQRQPRAIRIRANKLNINNDSMNEITNQIDGKKLEDFDEGLNLDLFEKLKGLRKELANAEGMPPYIIFHDSSLKAMATHFPRNLSDFRKISGVGEIKLNKYGELFVKEIVDYCNKYKYHIDDEDNTLIPLIRSGKTIPEIAVTHQQQPHVIRIRGITGQFDGKKSEEYGDLKSMEKLLENAYSIHRQLKELRNQIRILESKYNSYIEEAKIHGISQQGVYQLKLITRKRRRVDTSAFFELYPEIFVKLASIPVQAAEKEVGRDAMEKVVTYTVLESYVVTKTNEDSDNELISTPRRKS